MYNWKVDTNFNFSLSVSLQCCSQKKGPLKAHQVWNQYRRVGRKEVSLDLMAPPHLPHLKNYLTVTNKNVAPHSPPGGNSNSRSSVNYQPSPELFPQATCSATWATPSWVWTPFSSTWRYPGAGYQVNTLTHSMLPLSLGQMMATLSWLC